MTTAIPCHVTAELPETVDERIQAAAMKRQSLEDLRHAQLTEKLGHLPSATAASDTAQATPSTYVALFQPPEHNSPASDRHEAVLQRRRDMEEHRAIALDEQMKIEESRQNHAVELRKDALEEKRNAAHASLEDVSKAYSRHLEKVNELAKTLETTDAPESSFGSSHFTTSTQDLRGSSIMSFNPYGPIVDARMEAVAARKSSINDLLAMEHGLEGEMMELKQDLADFRRKEALDAIRAQAHSSIDDVQEARIRHELYEKMTESERNAAQHSQELKMELAGAMRQDHLLKIKEKQTLLRHES